MSCLKRAAVEHSGTGSFTRTRSGTNSGTFVSITVQNGTFLTTMAMMMGTSLTSFVFYASNAVDYVTFFLIGMVIDNIQEAFRNAVRVNARDGANLVLVVMMMSSGQKDVR